MSASESNIFEAAQPPVERRTVTSATEADTCMIGARVVSVECVCVGKDYGQIIMRLDNGVTLYADAPSIYVSLAAA